MPTTVAAGARASDFLLPDLGEGLTEAEIVTWLVSPGDIIAIDQVVVEVESAKSVVELPSPYGGRVQTLHGAAGDIVQKGAPLITVVPESVPPVAPAPADVVPGTALRGTVEPEATSSGAVLVGYGTKESTVRLQRPAGGRFGRGGGNAISADSTSGLGLLDPVRNSPVVSPIARKLAKDNGFDASHLLGTGLASLVVRSDVESAIAARTAGPAGMAPSSVLDDDLRIPVTGLRKLVATRLSESRRIIPEVTIWLDVDATELFNAKDRLQRSTGERFSITALIARFVVAGLLQYPILNASVSEDGAEIIQHRRINLGLAAQTPRGLMVPVVHDAHAMSTRELRDAIAAVVATSERGDFRPAALAGGTFTLNNYGGFGVDGSTPIINHPEVGMLGIGRVIERPWVVDHQLAVRSVMQLSFVFDHRVCDGDVASGFLTFVARCVEEPLLLLGNV
ncbi:dihydrolipoamide acetyltransferase family protein [Microterricola viridarii]|uniref:Dihydrolipoamide acetyltransferase component of pyruvate dehydrogenase complex n=1 Tax=Microterricola viridarii TaxID=412690 RepID=A0A0Y0Q2C3_9MICO|nr:dihydrolipoamide acetyltransferase family protein [Microterricola viridarii]AMB60388.1 hypothetical protein AWU67_06705 [Microterricola viridarii]